MPSRFEPCGLNQMYSMRYGTLPIVRATGGLEDTVVNFHPEIQQGTGFKLWTLDSQSLTNTTLWAVQAWRDQPQAFESMRRRAMRLDFSWRRAASHYESLYNLAIARKRGQI
jgi:starch synthase